MCARSHYQSGVTFRGNTKSTKESYPQMPLSDTTIRNAKPKTKPYKLFDEGGLFVIVTPNGGKWWRHKFRHNGKEQLLSFGTYPEVGLKDARAKRDDARKLLSAGGSPSMERKRRAIGAKVAAENTFKALSDEFLAKIEGEDRAEATLRKTKWLASHLGEIGKRPVAEIEPFELLAILKAIERKGNHESAKRVRAYASRVFRYAIITGRATHNPAADLGGALVTPKVIHHAAILEAAAVGQLLRAIDGYIGNPFTLLALRLAPHLFVRPGELRKAEWTEFNFDGAVWRIPAAKMKMRSEHVVPLSRQAIAILQETRALAGKSAYVFPSLRTHLRPMSENTLNGALRRLGYGHDEMTAHGFRSTASTLLNESGKWSPDAIERALAHKDGDAIRGIYHRGAHWQERVEMAQWWSDFLDGLKAQM